MPHGHPLKNQRTKFVNLPHIQHAKIVLNFQLVFIYTNMRHEFRRGERPGDILFARGHGREKVFRDNGGRCPRSSNVSDPRTRDSYVARPVGQFRNCPSLDSFQLILVSSWGSVQFSCSVMSNSATPWTAAHQACLSITISWSLLKVMSIESVMPSNHLTLCCPLLLLLSTFPSMRVFSSESVLHIRWPKYWG